MRNIVTKVCVAFLITSPISQGILGLAGGFIAFVFFDLNSNAYVSDSKLMGTLSIISICVFGFSKSKFSILISTILSTFFVCNFVLFFSMNSKLIPHFFYPQSYIIGSIVSFIILKLIEKTKQKKGIIPMNN